MAPPPRGLHNLLLLLLLIAAANADDPMFTVCPSDTNYTRGGAFQANLDSLLSSLPAAAAAASGFAKNATGAASDEAYGLAQCRADADASSCRTCLDSSVQDMAKKCPGQKVSMLIYDTCLLRHANASFFGTSDTSVAVSLTNTQNATQPERFRQQLGKLMSNLTGRAAYASPRMFAAGWANYTPFEKIYGMTQCTRDLADDDCNRCLAEAISRIPKCCDGKQGGQVIFRSCSIRFEVYPFYNAQAAEAAMSPAPAPTGVPVNGSDRSGEGSTGK